MSQELKVIEILKELEIDISKFLNSFDKEHKKDDEYIGAKRYLLKIKEAVKELKKYEQNFNQREFDYRTQCQKVLSTERLAVIDMPDKLAELEKVILDYYLAQGYEIGVGEWNFNVDNYSFYKSKRVRVIFWDYEKDIHRIEYNKEYKTTKEMWDKSIEHFTTLQNEV